MEKKYKCYACGVACTGRLQVQLRLNSPPKPFCEYCFDLGRSVSMRALKKKIKDQKIYIVVPLK